MAFLARSSIFSSQDGSRHRSPLSPIWKFVMGCGFNNRANSVALLHGGFERRDGAVVESFTQRGRNWLARVFAFG